MAEHPSADAGFLDRIDKFATVNPACCSRIQLASTVAATRQRLALLGDYCEQLHTAPLSKLVELAGSGVLCAAPATQQVIHNPLFDAEIAVRILETAIRLDRRDYSVEHLLRDWAPDLASALRIQRAMFTSPSYTFGMSGHVAAASTDELVDALATVADSAEWALRLAVEISCTDTVNDEIVGRFGWFPYHAATAVGTRSRVGSLTVDYLYSRFGAHIPTWQVFASIADPTTSLADAADLAIHAEPPPAPPPVPEMPTPEPPAQDALCEQVALF